jgi:hypothetical protein
VNLEESLRAEILNERRSIHLTLLNFASRHLLVFSLYARAFHCIMSDMCFRASSSVTVSGSVSLSVNAGLLPGW